MNNLTEEEIELAKRFDTDFPFRAKNSLFIKSSSGQIKPLKLNRAQLYVHEKLEEQKQKQGYIRAVIVKARKEGISTLVAGRYFDNIIRKEGQKAFILAHRDDATNNLYDMVDVLYENYPQVLRPNIKESNAKRLFFDNGSGYSVGTAGSGEVGRGDTIHYLHMSECALYENGGKIVKGLMQAVYDLPGTEIIIESTANGRDNIFYELTKIASNEASDYQLIFLPWFLLEEYRLPIPQGFILDEEEEALKLRFKLDDEQIVWRRSKRNGVLGHSGFMNEFPATIEEAFQSSVIDKLIPNSDVLEARNNHEIVDTFRKPIIGVDPAGSGKDKTVIMCRRGRHQYKSLTFEKLNTQQIVEQVINVIRSEKPAKVFIDKGFNPGIYDRLVELGFGNIVIGVQFGGQADEPLKYGNKRAEMYFRMKNWFADKPVRIQDDEELHVEICAVGVKDSQGKNRIFLNDKKEIREQIGRSPDRADALCFIGSTLIKTPKGNIQIKDLRIDDEVFTPFGKTRIKKIWESHTNHITTAKFSNGSELQGKGEHKIFSWNGGQIRLDALSLVNVIETFNQRKKWRILSLLFIRGKNIEFRQLVDTFKVVTNLTMKDFYIVAFGRNIMALSQKVMIFITKIITGVIMILPIWSAWKEVLIEKSTCLNTCKILNSEKERLKPRSKRFSKRQNGIEVLKELSGIKSMVNKLGLAEKLISQNVLYVKKNTRHFLKVVQDFVLVLANKKKVIYATKQLKETVFCVIKNLFTINIECKNVVPVSVQVNSEQIPIKVYNLTLERDNAYYANEVLVFNCLTFSYNIASYEDINYDEEEEREEQKREGNRNRITGY